MSVAGQLGIKTETTYNTGVTPDLFPAGWLSGNPVREQPPLVSKGMRKNRMTPTCISTGAKSVAGSVSFELYPQPLATLLTHMFGSVVTTGAGPYTHTATPAVGVSLKSFTAQFGIPGTAGTVHPFTMTGCALEGWTIKGTAGEIATLDIDVVAKDYVTATALATASYLSGCPFTFVQGSVSVAGVAQTEIKSFEYAATLPRRKEHYIGSATIAQPVLTGMFEQTINIEAEFQNLTIHDLANTAVAIILAFSDGTNSLTITTNAWMNATTPEEPGVDSLPAFNYSATPYGSTDAAAATAVLINSESSAA